MLSGRDVRCLAQPILGTGALDVKTFEQMKMYQDMKKRIETVVNLLAFTDELFPRISR